MDIAVEPGGYGAVSPDDIAAVLKSAGGALWFNCAGVTLPGIDVYFRPDHPQLDLRREANGRIRIGLSARDTRWAQYSFQFGHEFCHALANFGNAPAQTERYPVHPNLWFEEALCETASLFVLHAMARSWSDNPPYPAWKDYAPWFDDYARERLAWPRNHLPRGVPFAGWFQRFEPDLRRDAGRRDRNTIVASQLLPLFEAEPRGWRALACLNRDRAEATDSLAQHLAAWQAASPRELRPFVSRIAETFAVTLPGAEAP